MVFQHFIQLTQLLIKVSSVYWYLLLILAIALFAIYVIRSKMQRPSLTIGQKVMLSDGIVATIIDVQPKQIQLLLNKHLKFSLSLAEAYFLRKCK